MRLVGFIFTCTLFIGKVFGVGHLRSSPFSRRTLEAGLNSAPTRKVAFFSSIGNVDPDAYGNVSALQVSYARGGARRKQPPAGHDAPRSSEERTTTRTSSSRLERLRREIQGTRVMSTWLRRWNFQQEASEQKTLREEIRRKTKANSLALQIIKNEQRGTGMTEEEERDNYALEVISGHKLEEWFYVKNLRDSLTGNVVLEQGRIRFAKVLGDGATATVYLVEVHQQDASRLGYDKLALKFMKHSVGAEHMTSDGGVKSYIPGFILNSISGFMEREVEGAKLLLQKAQEKTSRGVSRQFKWSIPLFTGEFAHIEQDLILVDNVMYNRTFFLLEVMQGDLDIIYYQGTEKYPGMRLSVQAKQYACMRLIAEVAFLHSVNMVHYDIKPANILVSEGGDVMLADFGMLTRAGQKRPCNNNVSAWFMDPDHSECFLDAGDTKGNKLYDTWAVGVTCFAVMADGKLPYQLDSASGDNIVRTIAGLQIPCHKPGLHCSHPGMKRPEEELLEFGISPLWARIVELMLTRNRSKRPSLEQIVVHYDYFQNMPLQSNAM